MPTPPQLGKFNFTSLKPEENIQLGLIVDRINHTLGYSDQPFTPAKGIDLQGKTIANVGAPVGTNDAVSLAAAEARYSAPVLKPQLDAGGSAQLSTYRMLNSKSQRENSSSWLNSLLSTPPNASSVFPTLTVSGGQVQVSIPASKFQFADQSIVQLQGRTDLLSLPAQYAISSLAVAGGVVTCDVAATGLIAGEIATCVPGTNLSFAGTFQLTSSTSGGAVLEWQSAVAGGTDSSGYIQVNSVYYYAAKKNQNYLTLLGPYSIDSAQNRLQVNFDGFQIVAVVTITNSGGQISSSGGGGTPLTGSPAAGSFF